MATDAVGFWSYVQQDNDGDHGRIKALADDLREQYRLLTAEKLELFVDREDTEWGDAWKERIDSAIAGTTFFIPIITPSYFRSPECRRELLKFAREADRLGLGQLLLSVYWVRVSELENEPENSADEAVRLVAKYKWQDLRDERLEELDSAAYRKAVANLAAKLVERAEQAQRVEDVPPALDARESAEEPEDDGGPGTIERLVAAEDAMPRALALLEEIRKSLEEISGKTESIGAELQAAAKRGLGTKAALSLTNRLAHEISQPAENMSLSGHEYGQVLAELDSGVRAQLDMIEQLDEPTEENEKFLRELIETETAAIAAQEQLEDLLAAAQPVASLSRSLRSPLGEMRSGLQGVIDGNAVFSDWAQRAITLLGDNAEEEAESEAS